MPDHDEARPPVDPDPEQRYLIEPDLLWVESVTERLLGPLVEHLGTAPASRGPSSVPAPARRVPAPEQGPPRWSGPRLPDTGAPPGPVGAEQAAQPRDPATGVATGGTGVDPLDPRISLEHIRAAAPGSRGSQPAGGAVIEPDAPSDQPLPAPPSSSWGVAAGTGRRLAPEEYLTRPTGPEGTDPGLLRGSPPLAAPEPTSTGVAPGSYSGPGPAFTPGPGPAFTPPAPRGTGGGPPAGRHGSTVVRRTERVMEDAFRVALATGDSAVIDLILRLTRELAISHAQRGQLEAWLSVILDETAEVFPGAALLRTLLRTGAEPSAR